MTYPPDPPPINDRATRRARTVVRDAIRHLSCGVISHLALELAASVSLHPDYHARLWCDGCAAWCPREEFRWRDGSLVARGDEMR